MNIASKYKYYIILHFTVLIWGFTGVLGKLIQLPSSSIVIGRMFIAYITLLVWRFLFNSRSKISLKQKLQMWIVGLITAAHWLTFFEAIKVSNVSVTLSCLASCSLFVALIEPFFFKTKLKLYEILLGLVVVAGIYIIFAFEEAYSLGILLSLISALMAAIFSIWNAKLIQNHSASTIAYHEMLGGTITMIVFMALTDRLDFTNLIPIGIDWFYMILLGVVCTAFAFLMGIEVLKVLSPFTVSISVNMEPIYAIILALLVFGDSEVMTLEFYYGVVIIIGTILINAYMKSKEVS